MIELQKVWKNTLEGLSANVSAVNFGLWLEPLEPLGVKNGALVLVAPTANVKKTASKPSYSQKIKESLVARYPTFSDVIIIEKDESDSYISEMEETLDGQLVVMSDKKEKTCPFIEKYTFQNFVVGDSNKLAFHAAETVAKKPGSSNGVLNFNPLFIYGGVGLGKTHLLHSIGNYIFKNYPSLKIEYVQTSNMVNDYFTALNAYSSNKDAMLKFNEKYRNVDVLMMDDVQFLVGKTGVQEQFFHIFNDLYGMGKQIILSSDRPPKEIDLHERLISRFQGGILVEVGMPNLDMRIAIVRRKMGAEGVAVNDDVVFYLAEKIDSNVRELEGALSKVILYAQLLNQSSPTLELAKEALKIDENNRAEDIDSNSIINAVCSYYGLNKGDLLGKKKTKAIADARMVAIYIVNDMLSLPLETIGQIFGGRHHSTIIYARDTVMEKLKEGNKKLERDINDIKSLISGN